MCILFVYTRTCTEVGVCGVWSNLSSLLTGAAQGVRSTRELIWELTDIMETFFFCKNINDLDYRDLDKGLNRTAVRKRTKKLRTASEPMLLKKLFSHSELTVRHRSLRVIAFEKVSDGLVSMVQRAACLLVSDPVYLAFKLALEKQLTIKKYSQNQQDQPTILSDYKHSFKDCISIQLIKAFSSTSAVPNTASELSSQSGSTVLPCSSYSSQQTSDSPIIISNESYVSDSSSSLMPNSSASSHSTASSDTDSFIYSSDVETRSTTSASSLKPMSSFGNQTCFHQKSCADQGMLAPIQPTDFLHTTIPVVYQCARHHKVQQLMTPELDHASLLATASQLIEAQEYGAVVQKLTEIDNSMEPAELEAAKDILLGIALMQLKRYDEAIVVFQRVARFAGSASYAYYCLGEIELINHHLDSAAHYFQMALQLHNDLSRHLFHLIDSPKPSRCAIFIKLAQAQKNARDNFISSAVQMYQQAITAGESTLVQSSLDLAAHINLGNLLHSVGDHTAAVPHYKKGIELSEQCGDMVSLAWAHGNLGNAYLSLSQHKQAFRHLQHSLELTLQHEPTPPAIGCAYNNLGTYYQAVGDLDKAQECYDTALGHGVYGEDFKQWETKKMPELTHQSVPSQLVIKHDLSQISQPVFSDKCTSSVVPGTSSIRPIVSELKASCDSVMSYNSKASCDSVMSYNSKASCDSVLSYNSSSESDNSTIPYSSDSSRSDSSPSVVSGNSTSCESSHFCESRHHDDHSYPRQCEDPSDVTLTSSSTLQTLLSRAAMLMNAQYYDAVVQMLSDVGTEIAEIEAAKNILLGIALMQLEKCDEAIRMFQKAALFAEGTSCFYLGECKLINRCPANAIHLIQMALNRYKNDMTLNLLDLIGFSKPSLCAMLSKLAMAYTKAHKVSDAVQVYQKAIAVGGSDPSTPIADLIAVHDELGNLFDSIGDCNAALLHRKKSAELCEQCGDKVSHALAHGNLGNTCLSLSDHKKAFHYLQLSLELTLQHEPTPTAIGRAYNNLGTYHQAVGDLDKAQECYDTALGHAVYGQDQAGQARAYGNIGNVYMLKKNLERAIPHYSEVLRLTRDRLTAAVTHHNRGCAYFELAEKKVLKQSVRRPNQYFVHGKAACEMESEHKFVYLSPENAKHYHHALKDLDKVIKGHEETFASIKGSSSGLNLSVAWFETNAKTFLRAQDCAYSVGDHKRALVYAEQCRARTLGELLTIKINSHETPFHTPLQSQNISSIVKHLNTPNVPVVLLSYTGTRLLVWVLVWDGEEVKMTSFEQRPDETMFDGKTFDHYIRYSLSEMLTGGLQLYGGLEDQTISDESPAAKLYELIGRPLLRILEVMGCSGSRMVLVPDSYTKLLPFSALYDSKRQCFLGDSHSIVYSPSLLTLGVMSKMPHVAVQVPLDSKDMCVVGNPTTPPFMYKKHTWDIGSLPYATEEARSVAHMLQTTPLLHQEATKDAVLAKISRAKVIHLATHGSADGGFLVLGSSHNFTIVTKHTVEDPSTLLLHASELESLDIPAALVVLSSCDSGRGVIRGDDIQGMARSFLLAGARAVLTSLWTAPDESASFFMEFFYRFLLDGHKASIALQKTSLSICCFVKYSNFVHWSGHQLTGQDVMVTHQLSTEDRNVRTSLGIDSTTFPRFDILHCLTDSLTQSLLAAGVQLVCGPPGVDLREPVTDFICSNHSHYPGGIVWLHRNYSNNSLQDQSESTDRALVILDGYDEIPPACPNSSNIDIIIISNGVSDDMRHHVRSSLNRPVSVHEVKPLSELHATQRLVYSVQSSVHLPPSAADRSAFQQLAHLTMGSPILIRMVQYLLHHNMKHSSSPSEGLLNTVDSIEEMMLDDASSRLAVISAVCNTLSTAARRLLHCLSCLDGLPVSLEYIESIANMIQPNHQPTLVTELRQTAVLLGYPSPVVIGPTSDKPQSPLLYVPVSVAESVWIESSLHNKALSLLVIKNAIMKSYCDTVCHQVLKSWETTMINDSQDHDTATILCLKEHFIELIEKYNDLVDSIKKHSPSPATKHSLSPGTKHSLSPATKHSPLPATKHSPSPATKHSPLSATKHSPSPATKHSPSPATKHSPLSATKHSLSPATKHSPLSATKHSPLSATKHSPSSATKHFPSPATKHSLPPATKRSPSSATKHSPSSATKHFPSPATKHSPSSATKHSPSSATKHSPSSATKHFPSPATKHSPSSATKHSPSSATNHSPSSATKHSPSDTDARFESGYHSDTSCYEIPEFSNIRRCSSDVLYRQVLTNMSSQPMPMSELSSMTPQIFTEQLCPVTYHLSGEQPHVLHQMSTGEPQLPCVTHVEQSPVIQLQNVCPQIEDIRIMLMLQREIN